MSNELGRRRELLEVAGEGVEDCFADGNRPDAEGVFVRPR
jgi:hypothetical protein